MEKITLIELLTLVVSLFSLSYCIALIILIRKKKHFVKSEDGKVRMDYEREEMEKRIIVDGMSMTSNPLRFNDMNHLILENSDKDLKLTTVVADNSFFDNHGISLKDYVVEPGYVACLMPFVSSFNTKYETIKLACEDAGMHCHRSDEDFVLGDILKYTLEMILKSQIIIAVLDGRNANVYYEMGIAQSIGKPVIMIADAGKMREIPFDVQSNRMIFYKSHHQLREKLSHVLINNLSKKDEPRTKE